MQLFLLLGGNLGDRQATLQQATNLLIERVGPLIKASLLYETAAWGVTNQPPYLNQVLELQSTISPLEVLAQTQAIEQSLGRVRLEKWGPRTLDIDLLYYGDHVLQTDPLTLPHPLISERRFALVPLCDVAPNFIHPVIRKTNQELLKECPDDGLVSLFHTHGC